MSNQPLAGESLSARNEQDVALLLTDIRDSVRLWSELGRRRARKLLEEHDRILFDRIQAHAGVVLKTMGDGLFAVFDDAAPCLDAAADCMQSLRTWNDERPLGEQLRVRMAAHYGRAILERNDVFGDVPNVTSRVLELAQVDQILFTAALCDRLPMSFSWEIRPLGPISVPGKTAPLEIYDLGIEPDQVTISRDSEVPSLEGQTQLELRHGDKTVVHPGVGSRLLIGRSEDCDFPIPHPRVSRHHCEIVYQSGQYLLRDFSLNGTDLHLEDRVQHATRGSLVWLRGRGEIAPGGVEGMTISYRVFTV